MGTTSDADMLGQGAFAPFVERHHLAVYRYAARRLGPSEADDIVNETFAAAYTQRAKFDASYGGDARPWLLGIATNLIRQHTRREAAALRAYAKSGVDPVAPDSFSGDPLMGQALAAALASMRKEHRDVLLLHAIADLSHEEIGVALGVPVGTVKGWLHRARAAAAKELAARGMLEEPPAPDRETVER
jgi:RNA polymerase sigma factor (sigma-70 family)